MGCVQSQRKNTAIPIESIIPIKTPIQLVYKPCRFETFMDFELKGTKFTTWLYTDISVLGQDLFSIFMKTPILLFSIDHYCTYRNLLS